MSARRAADIEAALRAKGFHEVETHHHMYWFWCDGKKTSIRTRVSHAGHDYGDQLLGLVARQLKLTRGSLDQLLDCPLSEEGYVQLLMQQGILVRPKPQQPSAPGQAPTPGKEKKPGSHRQRR